MANTTNFNITLLEASKFKINTQYFSPHDLSLFVESLETITRLTREKEERKEQKKLMKLSNMHKKFSTLPRISSMSTLDSSSSNSADELDDEEELLLLENKKLPKSPASQRSEYDESYFSAPNSAQSSPRNSVIYQQQLSKNSSHSTLSIITTSDSEESGVFPIGSSHQDLYESQQQQQLQQQSANIRPRSKVITKSRSLSTRSRLINLVMKKESVPSVELISCRALDEYETLEMYEQEQQQMLQAELVQESEKLARFSTLHMKKKSRQGFACPDGSSEERFLDKALRYLTL